MNFILKRKVKYYTKEILRLFNITVLAFGFIIAILLMKYKPMYQVSVSGEELGYVQNKKAFEETIENELENYQGKNVDTVTLEAKPEYQFKLVNKTEDTNEEDIKIALQKELNITYKYYEIALKGENVNSVDTKEEAEQIVNEIKAENQEAELEIIEKTTQKAEEIQTNIIEVARSVVLEKINGKSNQQDQTDLARINGIKIAVLPITGTISSRYGVSSRIRSSNHTGLDIAAPTGTKIKVVADGTITAASNSGSYGNLVKVDHGNGLETWYAHTSKMYVKAGQQVSAGEVIAAVGSTGNSTGPHLHLEIRINGQHVNPQKYLYN